MGDADYLLISGKSLVSDRVIGILVHLKVKLISLVRVSASHILIKLNAKSRGIRYNDIAVFPEQWFNQARVVEPIYFLNCFENHKNFK